MSRVQAALLPAVIFGIVCLLMVTQLIANPRMLSTGGTDQTQAKQQPGEIPLNAAADPVPAINGSKQGTPQPNNKQGLLPASANSSGGVYNGGCTLNPGLYAGSVIQWCELIEKHARQNGLEPGLVAALITQESGGDPSAYSSSGAVGLMQVMPKDGLAASFSCPGGPCFSDRPSSQELMDPEYNIEYGTRMLSGLVQRYGTVREALKHYGPINVGYYYADLVLGIFGSRQ